MRILLAMSKWDYNDQRRGFSFQYETLFPAFKSLNSVEVRFCDTSHLYSKKIKSRRMFELKEQIKTFQPHQIWFLLSQPDDIDHELLLELKENPKLMTCNWYADDSWRFEDFTTQTVHLFDRAITTDAEAYKKYQALGISGVIKTQWAAAFLKKPAPPQTVRYDVSFCGQPHTDRRLMIETMRRKGFPVETFGYGWSKNGFTHHWNRVRKYFNLPLPSFSLGKVSQQEMHDIFQHSRINLHFSKNSAGSYAIHARTFEVPGLGGFLLSEYVEGLEEYFRIGEEIDVFHDGEELSDKVAYYLANDDLRIKMAEKGFERVAREHMYTHRLTEILKTIGQ